MPADRRPDGGQERERGRAESGRMFRWQEAELDAPRVVHAGNTSIPNIGLEYDLRLTLWGQRRLPVLLLAYLT